MAVPGQSARFQGWTTPRDDRRKISVEKTGKEVILTGSCDAFTSMGRNSSSVSTTMSSTQPEPRIWSAVVLQNEWMNISSFPCFELQKHKGLMSAQCQAQPGEALAGPAFGPIPRKNEAQPGVAFLSAGGKIRKFLFLYGQGGIFRDTCKSNLSAAEHSSSLR